jgi:hypothetical protein
LITGTRELAAKALDHRLFEGADHHHVAHPRDHLRGVLDRLAALQLRIAAVQVDRRTAELLHAGFERQARARARLLEDHHQRTIAERPVLAVGLELGLDPARPLEQMRVLGARAIPELEKVFDAVHGGSLSGGEEIADQLRQARHQLARFVGTEGQRR